MTVPGSSTLLVGSGGVGSFTVRDSMSITSVVCSGGSFITPTIIQTPDYPDSVQLQQVQASGGAFILIQNATPEIDNITLSVTAQGGAFVLTQIID
jgi:hypothetical protein